MSAQMIRDAKGREADWERDFQKRKNVIGLSLRKRPARLSLLSHSGTEAVAHSPAREASVSGRNRFARDWSEVDSMYPLTAERAT
jgi:hypothetical protein